MTGAPSRCRILVGTSGYSYTEWTEAGFYPPGTPAGGMLAHYARFFPITELNYTWYQMPKAEALSRMGEATPPDFLFTAKLTRTLTHEVDPDRWPLQAAAYREGVAPLVQAGRLAAVLAQFPPGFHRTRDNRRYLAALLEALEGLPLAVEFRNVSWATDRVFETFSSRRIALVSVDVPDLPGLFPPHHMVTRPDFFYIRFHGRNAAGWRSGKMQKQFDYDYSREALTRWIEERILPMAAEAGSGIVMFNNHVRAQAPANALEMMRLLKAAGFPVPSPSKKTL